MYLGKSVYAVAPETALLRTGGDECSNCPCPKPRHHANGIVLRLSRQGRRTPHGNATLVAESGWQESNLRGLAPKASGQPLPHTQRNPDGRQKRLSFLFRNGHVAPRTIYGSDARPEFISLGTLLNYQVFEHAEFTY